MTALRLPSRLAECVASDTDPARQRWVDRLGDVIAQIAGQWELKLGDPFEPGGACAWVAPARTASGEQLVVKVGWVHPEATHEAAGLRFWDGNGAVRLHACELLGDCLAMLLERCEPGTMLAELPEPDQDEILCTLLPPLWREPPVGHDFPSLAEMCERWAREYEAKADRQPLDPGIERAGIELFRTLPASADRQVLLATDLHAQNVLAAQREPWLAIDPKPHIGDPAYDPLQHMINCERVVVDPAGLARRHAELLGLDPERLRLWLFARCVQGSPDWPELAEAAVRLAP
ncbi:MAG TPA: aminoglycoside phosphotransferase family protein [Streptosporangiaceae bacterium]|nr:aminoglycoside phosphotransferase family protein [Streptosporangiaceae bacterium]